MRPTVTHLLIPALTDRLGLEGYYVEKMKDDLEIPAPTDRLCQVRLVCFKKVRPNVAHLMIPAATVHLTLGWFRPG